MKCPACDSQTPSGRPRCIRCGAPVPMVAEAPPAETPAPERAPFQPPEAETTRQDPEGEPSGRPETTGPPPAPWDPPGGPVPTDPIEVVPPAGPPFGAGDAAGASPGAPDDDPPRDRTETLHLPGDLAGAPSGPYAQGARLDSGGPRFGRSGDEEHPPWPPQSPYGVAADRPETGDPYDAADPPAAAGPYRMSGGPPAADPYGMAGGPPADDPYGMAGGPVTDRAPFDEDDLRYPVDDEGMRYPGVPPSSARKKSRTAPVAAGIVVAALIGGVVAYGALHDSGTGTDPRSAGTRTEQPPANAQSGAGAQAAAVNTVLQAGNGSHQKLAVPINTCTDLTAAVPVFQQVVQDRQRELARTKQLQVDRLPRGADLRQAMIDTYANSLAADRAYLAWAQAVQAKNCGKKNAPRTPDYARAVAANHRAGPAKRRVVALWNPIARDHDLPVYRWNQL